VDSFRFSFVKVPILALFALILAAGALAGLIASDHNPVMAATLVLVFVFFTLWAAGIASQLIGGGAVLRISDDGIFDRRIGPHTIPWSEIEEIYLFRARSQRFIAVVVKDPQRYAAPQRWADKLSLWINLRIGLPQFSLSLMGLNGSASRVLSAVLAHLPEQYDRDQLIR